MKSLQTICLLFATAGLVAAQQYTISTVAGIPQTPGLFPLVNPVPGTPAVSYTAPAIGPVGGGQLYNPSVVYVDSSNNIYIANSYTYVINYVDAQTGIMTILGGDGTPGTAGDVAAATSANITDVHGIAVDSNGNVFFSDTSSCRIRRIDNPSNNTIPNIQTVAGQSSEGSQGVAVPYCGPTANTPFIAPGALAFDSKGNLYITDRGSNTVRMMTTNGTVTTFAGTLGSYGNAGDGGPASKALLAYPVSLAFDAAGNLYIGDEGNNNIRKVDTSGNITTVATGVIPQGLGIDPAGNLYYIDGVFSSIKKIIPTGGVVSIAGNGVAGYAGDGTYNGTIYTGSQASQAQLNQPQGLYVNNSTGTIYVADTNNDVIRELVPVAGSLGVQDAASQVAGSYLEPGMIAPGELVTLFGSELGPTTLVCATAGSNGLYPTTFAGTSVTFNGTPAPIVYTSSSLVTVVVPYEITGSSTANIVLTYNPPGTSVISQFTASMPVAATVPALFTADASGAGQAAAVNVADNTVNGAANPAHLGSYIELYANGAGYTTAPVDGQPTPVTCGIACLPTPLLNVTVKIGNQTVTPSYAGGAPTLIAGVMQVNVQIPATLIPGQVLVQIMVGGYPSQSGITVNVVP